MIKDDWVSFCGDVVHRFDRDRLMCVTLASPEKRASLLALLAFNQEIEAIPVLVSEPMLGEIRLQWWRDVLNTLYGGGDVHHPVAQGLAEAIRTHALSRSLFDEYLDARGLDLNEEAPETIEDLANYLDGSAGALNQLMAEVLGFASLETECRTAVRRAGAAWALSGLLSFGRVRKYAPSSQTEQEGVISVVNLSKGCIAEARAARASVASSLLPVMAPVALVEHRLNRFVGYGFNLDDARLQHPGVGRLFGFYWKVLRKQY